MPTPTAVEITLSDDERSVLEAWTRRRTTAQALALRARIVLAAAGQLTNAEIAELEGVSRPTVTVVVDRPRAEKQLTRDLAIGQALGHEPGDLQLLRCELVQRRGITLARHLPGGPQLGCSAVLPTAQFQLAEQF